MLVVVAVGALGALLLAAGSPSMPPRAGSRASRAAVVPQATTHPAAKRAPWEASEAEAPVRPAGPAPGAHAEDESREAPAGPPGPSAATSAASSGSGESVEAGARPRPESSAEQAVLEAILGEIQQAATAPTLAARPTPERPGREDPTAHNATLEIIAINGYTPEAHSVRTADGYRLTVHRIANPGRKAVFLQHGLISSSADWVVMGKKHALAFLLHDAGYDVWLGNFRGNTYSKAHDSLTPKERAFWDFSWHEKGIHDVPAMIDYVLKTTQQDQLVYVGHSEGTTAFLVAASEKPEYNVKVAGFVALTPVAYLSNMKSIAMKLINKALTAASIITDMLGMYQFAPGLAFINQISKRVCSNLSPLLMAACSNTMFLFLGFNPNQILQDKIADIVRNVPSSTSTKTFIHFAQLSVREHFRQFDYGIVRNLIHYKRLKPPEYKLWRVVAPTYIHYAQADFLATPEDVEKLKNRLIYVKGYRKVPLESFNHVDVLYGKDAKEQLYDSVIENIEDAFALSQKRLASTTATPSAESVAHGAGKAEQAEEIKRQQ